MRSAVIRSGRGNASVAHSHLTSRALTDRLRFGWVVCPSTCQIAVLSTACGIRGAM